jgi:hypothetical protein
MFAADCPVCGHQLLPAGLAGQRERPSVTERHAAARVAFSAPLDVEAVRE